MSIEYLTPPSWPRPPHHGQRHAAGTGRATQQPPRQPAPRRPLEATLANLATEAFPDRLWPSPPRRRAFLDTRPTASPPTPSAAPLPPEFLPLANTLTPPGPPIARTCTLLLGPEYPSSAPHNPARACRRSAHGAVRSRHSPLRPRRPRRPGRSAILYPVTPRSLRHPPALSTYYRPGLFPRMVERLAACAQRCISNNQPGADRHRRRARHLNFALTEVAADPRATAADAIDLNSLLAQGHPVPSSLTSKPRRRSGNVPALPYPPKPRCLSPSPPQLPSPNPGSHRLRCSAIDSFRLAYSNLHEIWSLVLLAAQLIARPQRLSLILCAWFPHG